MILFVNNASSRIASACAETSSYIDVLAGTGALFPVPQSTDDYFMVTLRHPTSGDIEIMKVTSVSGDRFNVSRAQEGTTAMAFPQNTIVDNRLTAGSLEQLLNDIGATTSEAGRVRLATLAEALAGVVQDAAITPYNLKATIDAQLQPVITSLQNQLNSFKTQVYYNGYPGELRFFFESTPPAGWVECNGQLISNASSAVPKLWAELGKSANTWKLASQSQWDAMRTQTWATGHNVATAIFNNKDTDGSYKGGTPRFVRDTSANTLRVPDLRGTYMEPAGFDGLVVGGYHGDIWRDPMNFVTPNATTGYKYQMLRTPRGNGSVTANGPFYAASSTNHYDYSGSVSTTHVDFGRTMPTGNVTKPRAFGMLLCVCTGTAS